MLIVPAEILVFAARALVQEGERSAIHSRRRLVRGQHPLEICIAVPVHLLDLIGVELIRNADMRSLVDDPNKSSQAAVCSRLESVTVRISQRPGLAELAVGVDADFVVGVEVEVVGASLYNIREDARSGFW